MMIVTVSYRISNSGQFLSNARGEPTATLFYLISAGNHLELRVAIN